MSAALAVALVLAQAVYTWTDASGTVHYTDDAAAIPKGVKAEKTEGGALTTIEAPPKPKAAPREAAAAAKDEQLWRTRFRDARQKIADLEAQIDADAKIVGDNPLVVTRGRRSGRTRFRNQNAELEARLARNKQQLAREKAALDDLERRASFANVPREWRQ